MEKIECEINRETSFMAKPAGPVPTKVEISYAEFDRLKGKYGYNWYFINSSTVKGFTGDGWNREKVPATVTEKS